MDLHFTDHGSITVMHPRSDAGRAWIADHIPSDAMQWCGGIVIEHRYVNNIVEGAIADGLEIEGC